VGPSEQESREREEKRNAETSENDKWLSGVTLGLCLLGAVMIFSASAVTAEREYGHSYFPGAAGGMAVPRSGRNVCSMRTDYRKSEPAVAYSVLCGSDRCWSGFPVNRVPLDSLWVGGHVQLEIAKLAVICIWRGF
jgi:hypothetical protein